MDPQPSLFTDKELTTLEGVVKRVRFTSEDDAWSVVVVSLAASGAEATVVGNLAGAKPGESLRFSGRWTVHRKFGEQFLVESFTAATPATAAAIERYLGSGLIAGVGKELAARLVRKFGLSTLDVIESAPARLREVDGIGPVRAEQIVQAWRTQRDIREVMVFLQSCGVSTALAQEAGPAGRLVALPRLARAEADAAHHGGGPSVRGRGGAGGPVRAHGKGRQTALRSHRRGGPHHPPTPGMEPAVRRLPAKRAIADPLRYSYSG